MIIPDVNLLLYAYDTSSPSHERAKLWWERVLSGREPVSMAWVTILGFIRIGTHSRVFTRPMSIAEALAHVDSWLVQPVVEVIQPGPRHWAIMSELLRQARVAANLTTDAHLAALAIEYGATIYSSDSDFRRFAGLRLDNPLEG